MKPELSLFMKQKLLVLDGAMGTQIFARDPTVDDYGGAYFEGCVELLNVNRKQWIQEIHQSYFSAGADAVETNTFGCNEIVLSEFGIPERTFELNLAAAVLAREVARGYDTPKYVLGSVGPGTKLLTLLQVDYLTLFKSYFSQIRGLLAGDVDAILIETSQDLGQIKTAVRAARAAMKEMQVVRPIWVQITIETTGTMLVGTDVAAALTTIEALGVQLMGLNCATGPDEMRQHLAFLSQAAPFAISCLPNAGLPENVGGKTVYPLDPSQFAQKVTDMAKQFSLAVVGGCCGTTPEHIQALANAVSGLSPGIGKGKIERSVSSLYSSVPLNLEPRPLYVGERTNANGSKKFKELLALEDWDGLVSIAKGQLKEGAHILDVCVAYVGRNEVRDMEEFSKRLVTQVNIPIMIDSTEVNVIERALQLIPGKCIVNSINFEDGNERAEQVLQLCKEYGASVVALTIDETGMAKTTEHKRKVIDRIIDMACNRFGLEPGDVIIDPLTFTLGSGDEEFRKSALDTIEGIRYVKSKYPGVLTILGLSNISFGLSPYPRQILNSMMLFNSVKAGLDLAILNASKIVPVAKIDPEDRIILEDLLSDRRSENYDPLKALLARHTATSHRKEIGLDSRLSMSIEDRLKTDIIDGEKQLILDDVKEALKTLPPLQIINEVLLEGMKIVGERFGSGEMQLPFVLESAEAMKAAVKVIEPFLKKTEGYSKGKMLLATVKGDVHDIGKNLVEIILSNNGYEVVNLGIKQPIESIFEKYKEVGADAIGLSGLLVKSTVIMKENLEYLATRGIKTPVILGGAALTRAFVEKECHEAYGAPVFYALDAFEGLRIMEKLALLKERFQTGSGTLTEKLPILWTQDLIDEVRIFSKGSVVEEVTPSADTLDTAKVSQIKIVRKGESKVTLDSYGQSDWVRKNLSVPLAPFLGTKVLQDPIAGIFDFLDDFALIRSRWGYQKGSQTDAEFEKTLNEKAIPALEFWKTRIIKEGLLTPKAVYGYFPVCSRNEELLVYHPATRASVDAVSREVLVKFKFPRQSGSRRLSIADFFKNEGSGEIDILGVQLVTMGDEASIFAKNLYDSGRFAEYFLFHGLTTELTEAYAEKIHKQIRMELGVASRDATLVRQLFSQGYQGSRFSFGYPACPQMEQNEPLLKLLGSERIGVKISESYQMHPEQSTSALVSWHPQARYFSAL